ncbi:MULTISPECIES: hypothetical protein [Halomonadaceae]|jgi:hypothetical protein|uniref:Uncharacterized protein n=1 Tax=Billgrantia aerodenitrificans TaxID=2733483 RepID=A0ABS9ARK5_9GAMM|nr:MULTISPECIES: hypothetical protein [Halomonas]MCE8024477.1 hypothetical protein [Halomonas aerodenitrificans]
MAKTPWIPAAVALTLALGLAGCGDNGEEADATPQPEEPATEAEPDIEMTEDEPETPPPAAEEEVPTDDESLPAIPEEDAAELEANGELEADAETLGESPVDTLEEGGALPGEPTRSDIDAIIEDTERRFEEAQRQIDQQFEEVEQSPPALEPMESDEDYSTRLEPIGGGERDTTTEIDREAERTGEVTQSDIDAWLEETERRFEEAQRQLEAQFEEAERREPESEAPRFEIED